MKRALAALLILLLLGAASAAALAWWCTLWEVSPDDESPINRGGWTGTIRRRPGMTAIQDLDSAGRFVELRMSRRPDRPRVEDVPLWSRLRHPPETREPYLEELGAGWPLACLRYVQESRQPPDERSYFTGHGAIEGRNPLAGIKGRWAGATRLPVGPIWLNLFIDALLFGAVWFVFLNTPALWKLLRAIRRRRAGCCPWCGYDRRASDADRCPECGQGRRYGPHLFSTGVIWCSSLVLVGLLLVEALFLRAFAADPPYPAIHRAGWDGDIELIQTELANGTAPDLELDWLGVRTDLVYATPLWLAARRGHTDVMQCLIQAGANLEATGLSRRRPLHLAAEFGPLEAVVQLIEAGADINALDGLERDPLFLAAAREDTRIAQALLAAGAFPSGGALRQAVSRGYARTLESLIQYGGSPIDAVAFDDSTLLLWTRTDPADREIWRTLVESGIDVNAASYFGETPLMRAVEKGAAEFVRFLLAHGADPTLEDHEGCTAIDHATPEMRILLLRNMNQW